MIPIVGEKITEQITLKHCWLVIHHKDIIGYYRISISGSVTKHAACQPPLSAEGRWFWFRVSAPAPSLMVLLQHTCSSLLPCLFALLLFHQHIIPAPNTKRDRLTRGSGLFLVVCKFFSQCDKNQEERSMTESRHLDETDRKFQILHKTGITEKHKTITYVSSDAQQFPGGAAKTAHCGTPHRCPPQSRSSWPQSSR